MDRTGDMAELVVEHAPDFRMCDLLEDNGSSGGGGGPNPGGNSGNGPMIPVPQRKNSECGGLVAGKICHNQITLYINKQSTSKNIIKSLAILGKLNFHHGLWLGNLTIEFASISPIK